MIPARSDAEKRYRFIVQVRGLMKHDRMPFEKAWRVAQTFSQLPEEWPKIGPDDWRDYLTGLAR